LVYAEDICNIYKQFQLIPGVFNIIPGLGSYVQISTADQHWKSLMWNNSKPPDYITPRKLKIENKKAQCAAAYSNLLAREKALD
jgi:hypothetical protein